MADAQKVIITADFSQMASTLKLLTEGMGLQGVNFDKEAFEKLAETFSKYNAVTTRSREEVLRMIREDKNEQSKDETGPNT